MALGGSVAIRANGVGRVVSMKASSEMYALPHLREDEPSVLLHIGVHKTGTTALQAAFAAARPDLMQYGVEYPGTVRSHHPAARAVMRKPWGWGATADDVDPKPWQDVIERVEQGPNKLVLSSEFFGEATAEQAQQIVSDLSDRRVVVVVTLRPLLDLTPSSYQQFLKYGMKHTYEGWLEKILPYRGVATGPFWLRNDHGGVVTRWANLVGPENVLVIVLDPHDRELVHREISECLGIPARVLIENQQKLTNRSMTAAEAELIRLVNLKYRGPRDWRWYERYVRKGLIRAMVETRQPGPDEVMSRTPEWAQEQLLDVARKSADSIRESGVHVSGDLDALLARRRVDQETGTADSLPIDAVLAAVVGIADKVPATGQPVKQAAAPKAPPPPTLRQRVRRRLARVRGTR